LAQVHEDAVGEKADATTGCLLAKGHRQVISSQPAFPVGNDICRGAQPQARCSGQPGRDETGESNGDSSSVVNKPIFDSLSHFGHYDNTFDIKETFSNDKQARRSRCQVVEKGQQMREIFEFLARGGVVMIPILLGSIIALTIFLERIWSLQESRIIPNGLVDSVIKAVSGKSVTAAREECLKSNSPMGRLLLTGLDAVGYSRTDVRDALEESGKREVAKMERYIEAMGTTASVEPLLGLLGTVTGMIQVFQRVVVTSREGAVDPGELANGIWQALITTAAGLSVAILAFVGYRYLLARTGRHALEMEEAATKLLDTIHSVSLSAEQGESK
jgi:biopolymer transport protein ExbB